MVQSGFYVCQVLTVFVAKSKMAATLTTSAVNAPETSSSEAAGLPSPTGTEEYPGWLSGLGDSVEIPDRDVAVPDEWQSCDRRKNAVFACCFYSPSSSEHSLVLAEEAEVHVATVRNGRGRQCLSPASHQDPHVQLAAAEKERVLTEYLKGRVTNCSECRMVISGRAPVEMEHLSDEQFFVCAATYGPLYGLLTRRFEDLAERVRMREYGEGHRRVLDRGSHREPPSCTASLVRRVIRTVGQLCRSTDEQSNLRERLVQAWVVVVAGIYSPGVTCDVVDALDAWGHQLDMVPIAGACRLEPALPLRTSPRQFQDDELELKEKWVALVQLVLAGSSFRRGGDQFCSVS